MDWLVWIVRSAVGSYIVNYFPSPPPPVICLLHNDRGFLNLSLCSVYEDRQLTLAKVGKNLDLSIHTYQSTS